MPVNSGYVFADKKIDATTKVQHKALKYFVPGHRIQLESRVKDDNDVNIVRTYFRAVGQADYAFVPMSLKEGTKDKYIGILPAPSERYAIYRISLFSC